jgi:8-oxo-dGDP phosphatase
VSDLLRDEAEHHEVRSAEILAQEQLLTLARETVDYHCTEFVREFIRHPGAVAVVAVDDDGRVLLIQQYRHPIRSREWEIPAGLLDHPGESLLLAAQRELAEETELGASEWSMLVDLATSPGGSDELVRVFLARGLHAVSGDFVREAEEADIVIRWEPIDAVVAGILDGRLRNGILAAGVLAAAAARLQNWRGLRPAGSSNT